MSDVFTKRGTSEPLSAEEAAEIEELEALGDEGIDLSDMPEVLDWGGSVQGKYAGTGPATGLRLALPEPVARVMQAIKELETQYKRKFTLDGHLLGSIGEVIAAEALGLKLYEASRPLHDAHDGKGGNVQIKITAGRRIAMYGPSVRLVVLRIVSATEAEIVYDGGGQEPWDLTASVAKNGQKTVSLAALRKIAAVEKVRLASGS